MEKQNLLKSEKDKVKKEMERKEQQLERNKRINQSTEATKMRLELLNKKQEAVDTVVANAKEKLAAISQQGGQKYQQLLKGLMLQGARSMGLTELVVRCRKQDTQVVQRAKEDAQNESESRLGRKLRLTVEEGKHLPGGPSNPKESDESTCLGGVLLFSSDYRIDCRQTLDERLRVAYEKNLPSLRRFVFEEQS